MKLCLAIVGPTASGKSDFALELAQKIGGEILCLDSTTVYKGLDIGTAKPNQEAREAIPHHLLDLLDPSTSFNAFDFLRKAEEAISEITQRAKVPIIVGGTFFYLKALQHGMYPVPSIPEEAVDKLATEFLEDDTLNTEKMHRSLSESDPVAAKRIHPKDQYRLLRALAILRFTGQKPSELKAQPISTAQKERTWLKYALVLPRVHLHERIQKRTATLLDTGLIEETKALMEQYPDARALRSIGYAETIQFLQGKYDKKTLQKKIEERTRQLAKRQMTWIRSDTSVRVIDHTDRERVEMEYNNLSFVFRGQQT